MYSGPRTGELLIQFEIKLQKIKIFTDNESSHFITLLSYKLTAEVGVFLCAGQTLQIWKSAN